jgi:L-malate glycosyltransferase
VKVGIYNEPSGGAIGGAESSVAILAEALSARHDVDIVHHRRALTEAKLADVSGTSLQAVSLRYVEPEAFSFGESHLPWKRYRDARNWHADLSERYDLFFNFTHRTPPFCHARIGVLVVLFPINERPHLQSLNGKSKPDGPSFDRRLKNIYHEWEWQRRMNSYSVRTTISDFSNRWTRRRWGIDCDIVYPPVDTDFAPANKSNVILSVGRFASEGHSKKQLEMMMAFEQLKADCGGEWQYFSVGSLGEARQDHDYFESVRSIGQRCGGGVLVNLSRARLKRLFADARIFWHAAGFGEDEQRPELSEHFGIVTAEAMAAGCVPVVINRGAQSEIVEHGISGFLWDTLEELKQYTLLLSRDERLRAQMAGAARARADHFSRDRFTAHFLSLVSSFDE